MFKESPPAVKGTRWTNQRLEITERLLESWHCVVSSMGLRVHSGITVKVLGLSDNRTLSIKYTILSTKQWQSNVRTTYIHRTASVKVIRYRTLFLTKLVHARGNLQISLAVTQRAVDVHALTFRNRPLYRIVSKRLLHIRLRALQPPLHGALFHTLASAVDIVSRVLCSLASCTSDATAATGYLLPGDVS